MTFGLCFWAVVTVISPSSLLKLHGLTGAGFITATGATGCGVCREWVTAVGWFQGLPLSCFRTRCVPIPLGLFEPGCQFAVKPCELPMSPTRVLKGLSGSQGASTSSEELNAQITPRTDDEHNLPYHEDYWQE